MAALEALAAILSHRAVALSCIVAVVFLTVAFDLLLPLGAAAGMAYLLIVIVFGLLPGRQTFIVGAAVASLCVVAGHLMAPIVVWDPENGILLGDPQAWAVSTEIALLNRGIALLAIWGLALSLFGRQAWKENAGRERLLAEETDHRLKNILGQVQAVVRATKRTAPSPHAASDLILSRIEALAKTCSVLAAERWAHARLGSLVAAELEAHGEDRFELSGDDVYLTPKAGLVLGLVIHELATNATKYGALSVPEGRVRLDWHLSGEDKKLVLEWTEMNGPPVMPPERAGFGTGMIERAMSYELGATVRLEYHAQGVHCRMELPLDQVVCETPALPRAPVRLRVS